MTYLRISLILLLVAMIVQGKTAKDGACDANEVFNECGTHCQRTCADIATPDKMCNHMCALGCFCVNGYVRKTDPNSPCIKETEC